MTQATGKAPQVARPEPDPPLPEQSRKTSIVQWLKTWSQVLVAELLRATERRPQRD